MSSTVEQRAHHATDRCISFGGLKADRLVEEETAAAIEGYRRDQLPRRPEATNRARALLTRSIDEQHAEVLSVRKPKVGRFREYASAYSART